MGKPPYGSRPYKMPDGSIEYRQLHWCRCGKERRGPFGGVCGNCGGAIPEQNEVTTVRVTTPSADRAAGREP